MDELILWIVVALVALVFLTYVVLAKGRRE